jgi:hypothetical protein
MSPTVFWIITQLGLLGYYAIDILNAIELGVLSVAVAFIAVLWSYDLPKIWWYLPCPSCGTPMEGYKTFAGCDHPVKGFHFSCDQCADGETYYHMRDCIPLDAEFMNTLSFHANKAMIAPDELVRDILTRWIEEQEQ